MSAHVTASDGWPSQPGSPPSGPTATPASWSATVAAANQSPTGPSSAAQGADRNTLPIARSWQNATRAAGSAGA